MTGYAVVTKTEVLKAGQLPVNYSAQAAELVALTELCKLMTEQTKLRFTPTASMLMQQYILLHRTANRGMITSVGIC